MTKQVALLSAVALTLAVSIASTQNAPDIALDMAHKARTFLHALSSAERDRANLLFSDPNRCDWHYIPRARRGLPHQAMSDVQSEFADALMDTALSEQGQAKARGIRHLDQVLFAMSGRAIRDPDLYYVTVFGEPASQGAWGWRVEGHHLSLNLTIEDGEVISTSPTFMGANPAIARDGPSAGMQVLESEQVFARDLLRSFDPSQREVVVYASRPPRDIETGNSRRADPGAPRGLALSEMSPEQRARLMQLIEVYANRLRPALAQSMLEKIHDAGEGAIHFAWAGGAQPGQPHYYRIQGPTFLIEYDNRQNSANHIHSVWRDLAGGDFGEDVLARHYAESPHHNLGSTLAYVDPVTLDVGLLSTAERTQRAHR